MEGDLNSYILAILECPICLETITPPIYQCKNQHIVCGDCLKQIQKCSICRVNLSFSRCSRNLVLEEIASQLKYPCKFEVEGCKRTFFLKDMKAHMKECMYTDKYHCNLTDFVGNKIECDWSGSESSYHEHITDVHSDYISYEYSLSDGLCLTSEKCNAVFRFDNKLFSVKVLMQHTSLPEIMSVFFHVHHINNGSLHHAYLYKVVTKGSYGVTDTFEAYVGSLKTDLIEAASHNNCLHFIHNANDQPPQFCIKLFPVHEI